MKVSIKDFFIKCDQIRSLLWIWSHLLKKYLMGNFIFYAVKATDDTVILRHVTLARWYNSISTRTALTKSSKHLGSYNSRDESNMR